MEFKKSRFVKRPTNTRVILVRPLYRINVGLVARAMKNFSTVDLAIVLPSVEIGPEAYKFAKHSQEVLDNIKFYPNLREATRSFELVVGTTGVLRRFRGKLKNCISSTELSNHVSGVKTAFVFGSEDKGLNKGEVEQCDLLVHIPADQAHPVLNLSHAVAVTLYAAFHSGKNKALYKRAKRQKLEYLKTLFAQVTQQIAHSKPPIRDVEKTNLAFGRIVSRARIADDEVQLIFGALARMEKKLKRLESQHR